MKYSQIITSLLDNDFYKFTMGQLFLHQMTDMNVEWTYKNRDAAERKFTKEMVQEIDEQIKAYCDLRFKKDELDELKKLSRKIVEAVVTIYTESKEKAMSLYN
jgi:nicotinate phosphoribosyltransferase